MGLVKLMRVTIRVGMSRMLMLFYGRVSGPGGVLAVREVILGLLTLAIVVRVAAVVIRSGMRGKVMGSYCMRSTVLTSTSFSAKVD